MAWLQCTCRIYCVSSIFEAEKLSDHTDAIFAKFGVEMPY